eukprot:m.431366 g.431366  ORF g.431366 m.431366 type:complete len:261 (-) comp17293_c0_seq1:846-1628(-)
MADGADAAAAPVKNSEEDLEKFRKITSEKGIDAQCKYFLSEFVSEFSGNFEEVLDLAEEFKGYAAEGAADDIRELDEQQAHIFLEKRGEAATVRELRDALREIDIDLNMKVSFIEYCMYKYKKTLAQLFEEKPKNLAHLLKALDEAIELHQELLRAKKAEEEKMDELRSLAETGSGVKAMKAKAELEQMRVRSQTGANMAEVRAAWKTRKAKKDLEKGDPMAEEMKRVEAKKKAEEEEAERKKRESRDKLKARAAFLNQS